MAKGNTWRGQNTFSNTARPFGFRPDASGYTYDDNGNLKKDTGKNLKISSNVLNLPQKVWNMLDETDYLKIDYTFAGEKIRKREYENGTIKEDRFYLGGVEFVNSIAETYSHPEGRIQIVQTPGEPFKYAFQYKISDHLGNMAVFFEDSDSDGIIATEDSDPANSEVLQRHFYYSFGMEMQGAWVQPTAPENKYQYNGKELNENLGLDWYDYGARWYDAAVGRWGQADPLADETNAWSPYVYGYDFPLRFSDPTGMSNEDVIIMGSKKEEAFNELQTSVKYELKLSMDEVGKVTAEQIIIGPLSEGAYDLMTATTDNTAIGFIKAENTPYTSDKLTPLLAQFMGAKFNAKTGIAGATNEINPEGLHNLDMIYNTPGQSTLHEVTESYGAAKLAQWLKIPVVNKPTQSDIDDPNSFYNMVHNTVIPQSGDIARYYFGKEGKQMMRGAKNFSPIEVRFGTGDPPIFFHRVIHK